MNDHRTGRHGRIYPFENRWHYEVLATRGNLPDEPVDSSQEPGYADSAGAVEAFKREHPGLDWTVENDSD